MADSQGLSPGDTGYDPTTDPDSPQYGPNPNNAYLPPTPPPISFNHIGSGASGQGTVAPTPNPVGVFSPLQPGQAPPGALAALKAAQTPPPAANPAATGDINSTFAAFMNAHPEYASGGQAAIDAFGQAYPQYNGIIAWDPNRQVYESQGGYFTNIPGNPQGGWSLTPTQPESGGTNTTQSGQMPSAPLQNIPSVPQIPTPAPYTLPSLSDVENTPGYQFQFQQGEQALRNGQSAAGVAHGGAADKALIDYGQNEASTYYNNLVNQGLGAATLNNQTGLNYYNANVGNVAGQQNLGLGYQGLANNYNLGLGNLGLAQQGQGYNEALQTFLANYGPQSPSQLAFQNQLSLAQLGTGTLP